MFEYKKDTKGNAFKQDPAGHTEYLGKVNTGFAGEQISSIYNPFGRKVGTVKNAIDPKYDNNGYSKLNFNSEFPIT